MGKYDKKLINTLVQKIIRYKKLILIINKIESDIVIKDDNGKKIENVEDAPRCGKGMDLTKEGSGDSPEELLKYERVLEAARKDERRRVENADLADLDPLDYLPLEGEADNKEMYDEARNLKREISSLSIDLKMYPVLGASDVMVKLLSALKQDYPEKYVEKFLYERVEKDMGDMKKRMENVSPLIGPFYLERKTVHLYRQVINCYIYGNFEASCVLCRAIAEGLVKKLIERKGYGNELGGKNKSTNQPSLRAMLWNHDLLDKRLIGIFSKIYQPANEILHAEESISDNDAKQIIDLLREFIHDFPKCA